MFAQLCRWSTKSSAYGASWPSHAENASCSAVSAGPV